MLIMYNVFKELIDFALCTFRTKIISWIYLFQLNYKIRSKGRFPSAEARTNDGTGCRPTDDSINSTIFKIGSSNSIPYCEPTNYYHSGFLGLQAAIDFSWISVSKNLVLLVK